MRSIRERFPRKRLARYLAIFGFIAVPALLLVVGTGCGKEGAKEEGGEKEDSTMAVSTTMAKRQTLRRSINQPAVLQSYEETPIYTKLAGYLQNISVDIGDRVSKGELLADLYVPEVEEGVRVKEAKVEEGKADVLQAEKALLAAEADIKKCKADVDKATATVIRAEAQFKRWKEEYERDKLIATTVLPEKSVEESKKQMQAAEADVAQTKAGVVTANATLTESIAKRDRAAADVEVNKKQLTVWEHELEFQRRWFEYARITAPYDGIVTRRIGQTGHFAQPTNSGTTSTSAEPLFVVMRTDILRCVVQVPEYDAPLVKDGAEAILKLQAYRGHEIKCKVTRSSWALDRDSRCLRVECFLDNPSYFNVSDRAIDTMRKKNVPDALIAKLGPIKGKEMSRADFEKELNRLLSANERKQYQVEIMKRAESMDLTSRSDNPNAPLKLQAGMYGNISILVDLPNTLTLPTPAILTDGNAYYCFVIENGKARRVNVQRGIYNDQFTEVLKKQLPPEKLGESGKWVAFSGNEQVITSNLTSVEDGQPVKAK